MLYRLKRTVPKCEVMDGLDVNGKMVIRTGAVMIDPNGEMHPDNFVTLCNRHRLEWGRRCKGQHIRGVTKLEVLMLMYNISHEELSAVLGISRPAVSKMLRSSTKGIKYLAGIVPFIENKTGRKMQAEELFEEVEV